MAVDPELRAHLEAIRSEMTSMRVETTAIRADIVAVEERAVARDASTREALEAQISDTRGTLEASLRAETTAIRADIVAVEERAVARDASTRAALEAQINDTRGTLEGKIEEARREAGAMMESIIHEIRALPEGLSTFQRQEADRLDAAREEAMLNRHVRPLEASAANHENRIKAVERQRQWRVPPVLSRCVERRQQDVAQVPVLPVADAMPST